MRKRCVLRRIAAGLLLLPFTLHAGCASDSRTPTATPSRPASAVVPESRAIRRTVAMVDGQPVTPEEIWPAMAESAGGEALQDLILDRLVSAELLRRSIALDAGAAQRERDRLLRSLSSDRDEAGRLLEAFRLRQRLGPARFDALLRRTAALRALVSDDVRITESAMRLAHELATSPRRQVRIAVLPSLSGAEEAAARIRRGESFAEVAADLSGDASAARGGLLEPIAAADASWPETLRTAVFALGAGEISAPVLLDDGYAIATLVREIPAIERPLESMHGELETTVRLAQERILMDQLARRLLREAHVTVFDDALEAGWRPLRSAR